jgi:CO/xanthine dehydrogenase Mo-binding subunit
VRVVVPYVGGGYGTKSYTKIEPLAAVGSWITGLPVKVALSVEESVLTTRSDSAIIRARSGFKSNGLLVARQFDIVLNSGAYTDNSPQVAQKAANRCFGPYRIPHLSVRVRAVFTNSVPASSLRGFGAPQGNLAGELQMDEAAARLDMDAIELRLGNLAGPGEELIPGKRPLDANLADDLKLLSKSLGWPDAGEGAAIGLGLSASDAGAHPSSTALVRIHSDGSVSAMVGATELGQGSRTVLAQIAAQELGLPLDRVTMISSDTGMGPFEWTTGASRTTAIAGRSLQAACQDARARIRALAAEIAHDEVAPVTDTAGGVLVRGNFLSYEEAIAHWFGSGGEVVGTGTVRRADEFKDLPSFWEIGASGVIVSLDWETGKLRVNKLATVGDVGFAINPALVHGQDAGAAIMGLGAALYEELVYDGEMLTNPNVVDYRVPRFGDLPEEMVQILAERRDGIGPYGSKGVGEGALNPVGAAVASAVGRLIGVFPNRLPLTPERVWDLINERQEKGAGDETPA